MEFAIGWNQFNLTLLGVWPEPREISTLSRRVSAFVFWFTSIATFMFICAPQTANLILKSTRLDEVIENLSINVPIAFALAKQIVLRYHGKGILPALAFLVSEIITDWSQPLSDPDRQTMLKSAKLSRQISIVCSSLAYVMLLAFLSLQIWNNAQSASEIDLGGLLHPATFPYDTKKSPNFEITWLGQLIGTIAMAISYSCFDTFLAVLVLHSCGQLSVLRTAIENIAETRSQSVQFDERLGYIVLRHNQLLRFAMVVEDCFNLTLLVQTMICTAMLCLTGYRLLSSIVDQDVEEVPFVGMVFFILHVTYAMLHFFVYCYVGEELIGESTGVAQSAYDCIWYNLPPKQSVALIMLICRSRISFQITAGKFSPFSLKLFNTVVRTSAGYLSVLLARKE